MRNAIVPGFVIILIAIVVTGTGRNGTGSTTTNAVANPVSAIKAPGGGVYCTVIADTPRKGTGNTVIAPGRFTCDRPGADSLIITVTLQRTNAAGAWATVATNTFSAAGAGTTRDTAEAGRTRQVSVACAAGTYRTLVTAKRTSNKRTGTYSDGSIASTNPCGLASGR